MERNAAITACLRLGKLNRSCRHLVWVVVVSDASPPGTVRVFLGPLSLLGGTRFLGLSEHEASSRTAVVADRVVDLDLMIFESDR